VFAWLRGILAHVLSLSRGRGLLLMFIRYWIVASVSDMDCDVFEVFKGRSEFEWRNMPLVSLAAHAGYTSRSK
jgi:hypothetical protein